MVVVDAVRVGGDGREPEQQHRVGDELLHPRRPGASSRSGPGGATATASRNTRSCSSSTQTSSSWLMTWPDGDEPEPSAAAVLRLGPHDARGACGVDVEPQRPFVTPRAHRPTCAGGTPPSRAVAAGDRRGRGVPVGTNGRKHAQCHKRGSVPSSSAAGSASMHAARRPPARGCTGPWARSSKPVSARVGSTLTTRAAPRWRPRRRRAGGRSRRGRGRARSRARRRCGCRATAPARAGTAARSGTATATPG